MAKLFIPVGIPGCGKSTFARVLTHTNLRVHETDSIRAEMVKEGKLDDVGDMSRNGTVFELYYARIKDSLSDGFDVYADATNLRDFARTPLRAIADEVGAETHMFVFMNPSAAVQRNMKRSRVVPADVMVRMLGQYERMLADIQTETYTSITTIANTG